jgi:hypothetical protein
MSGEEETERLQEAVLPTKRGTQVESPQIRKIKSTKVIGEMGHSHGGVAPCKAEVTIQRMAWCCCGPHSRSSIGKG